MQTYIHTHMHTCTHTYITHTHQVHIFDQHFHIHTYDAHSLTTHAHTDPHTLSHTHTHSAGTNLEPGGENCEALLVLALDGGNLLLEPLLLRFARASSALVSPGLLQLRYVCLEVCMRASMWVCVCGRVCGWVLPCMRARAQTLWRLTSSSLA